MARPPLINPRPQNVPPGPAPRSQLLSVPPTRSPRREALDVVADWLAGAQLDGVGLSIPGPRATAACVRGPVACSAVASEEVEARPSLLFAMSFLIDSSIMITSQVSHRVPPQDSSTCLLSRLLQASVLRAGPESRPSRLRLVPASPVLRAPRGYGICCVRLPAPSLLGGVPRPSASPLILHSSSHPTPPPGFLSTLGRGQVALGLRAGAARRELSPKRPEALGYAADPWIREECGSGCRVCDSPIRLAPGDT